MYNSWFFKEHMLFIFEELFKHIVLFKKSIENTNSLTNYPIYWQYVNLSIKKKQYW